MAGPMISHLPHALVPWHLRPPSGCTPFSLAPAVEEERPVKRTQDDKWAANLRGGVSRGPSLAGDLSVVKEAVRVGQ